MSSTQWRSGADPYAVVSHGRSIVGVTAKEIQKELESRGIIIQSLTRKGLTGEKPEAYKDIEAVIELAVGSSLNK
jgi:RNA-splicing ligase RtcB